MIPPTQTTSTRTAVVSTTMTAWRCEGVLVGARVLEGGSGGVSSEESFTLYRVKGTITSPCSREKEEEDRGEDGEEVMDVA